MRIPGRCECEIEEARKQEQLLEQQQKRIRIERLFSASMLGQRFAECTFDNWIARPGAQMTFETCIDYVKSWDDKRQVGNGLIIYGTPGNGKSHLSAAIANSLLAREYAVIFANVPELLNRIRATFGGNARETSADIMSTLQAADLLILDDAGAEKWSDWVESTLYSIINSRYMNRAPVILTSNLELTELADAIGGRTFDRLLECCTIVENLASSYRVEFARKRALQIKAR